MENFATRFADFLEDIAGRVRSLTVDRVSTAITMIGIGIGAAVLGLAAFIFITVGLFRLLAIPLGVTIAYAVLGGLFLLAGALLWRMRNRIPEESNG